MNKKIFIYLLTTLLFHLERNEVLAQTDEERFKLYKDEVGVLTQNYNTLNVYMEKGKLMADLEVSKVHLIIDDQKLASFATESVYHNYFRQLESLEAGTMIPSGKDYKKIPTNNIKVKASISESVFFDDSKHSEISFTNLQKGNRTYFKYKVNFTDVHMLQNIMLQDIMPTEHFKLTVNIPSGMTIHDVIINKQTFNNLTKTVKSTKNKTTITWEANNIPAIKFQTMLPSQFYNIAHLSLRLGDFKNPQTGQQETFLTTPKDLSKYLNNFVKDINQTTDPALVAKVKEICKDATTEQDKAKSIYNWVQNNVRYIAYEDSLGGFIPREASLIFKRKFGDCKDMTSLLKVMCNTAGLDARYTWIGTDNLPYEINQTPVPSAFNHMICAVKVNGQWTFLDATDTEIPYGFIPANLQGKEAFIYSEDLNFIIYPLPTEPSKNHILVDTTFASINNDILSGKIRVYAQGSIAWEFRTSLKYESAKNYEKKFYNYLIRGNNKFNLVNFEYTLDSLENKDLKISGNYELPDYVSKYDQNYYVNLNFIRPFERLNFEVADRKVPIFLDGVKQLKLVTILEIPEGYKVSQLPTNMDQKYPKLGSVNFAYQNNGKQIVFNNTIILDEAIIYPAQFESLNKMVQIIQKNYKETIELTKK